ncbi:MULTISPECIES: helix-turn-helix domain-containing protein [Lactobacillus]|uniref:XRE family transcriptional regulator n=1 Tax=Lactobacillus xujianguonis TaxID=2495899 RepID=A0A437SY02_9LACO|nr:MULTISPECIES: helix-turn-helix transcriptional regulator [Lactobacillus]RVU71750.1 XRE family transcriptional regulator [Lactobacillus xujianguonis]RVU77580.1 XRE family transcriptional regulator [Lactobacillus xujianguonis]
MNINLGEEISRRRREQKLTQEDLAELSDLSVNFISRLERTKDQNISIQKLDAIARALNTTTPELINSAYRFKKVKSDGPKDNTPIFIQKVVNELRKLPKGQAERVCKSLIVILKEID